MQLLHNPFLLCLSGPETDLHSVSVQWWSQIKTAGIVREGDLTGWPACHTVFTIQQYIHTYASSTIFVHFLPGHTLPSSATLPSCQVYGYEYLPVLISLRKAGLLSLQEGKTHQSIRRQFRLLVEPTGRVCEKHKQIFTSLRIFYSQHPVANYHPSLLLLVHPPAPTLTPHYLILTLCSHPHPSLPHPHPLFPPSSLTTSSSPFVPTLIPHYLILTLCSHPHPSLPHPHPLLPPSPLTTSSPLPHRSLKISPMCTPDMLL